MKLECWVYGKNSNGYIIDSNKTGMRVDKLVFDRFKELCTGERLKVGEAVQHLMEACLEAGSVKAILASETWKNAAQRKADELRLRGALAELGGFIKYVIISTIFYVNFCQ